MNNLGAVIRKIRKARRLTLEEVAYRAGTDTGNLSRVERGKQECKADMLYKIAKALGVSVADIYAASEHKIEEPEEIFRLTNSTLRRKVPVVGTTREGPDVRWQKLGQPADWGNEYLEIMSPDPHAYVLRVKGTAMAPRMYEGEGVLVEPDTEPQPGDDVVVKTQDGQVMVKSLVAMRDGEIVLGSIAEQTRITLSTSDIVFMHFVAGVFNARVIKKR